MARIYFEFLTVLFLRATLTLRSWATGDYCICGGCIEDVRSPEVQNGVDTPGVAHAYSDVQ